MKNMNIRKILIKIGISANLKGHHCILNAVEIIKKQKTYPNLTTIYNMIAKHSKQNPASVERNIRHAIHQAYKNSSILKNIYEQLPNNSVFLCDLVFNLDVFESEIKNKE